MRGFLIVLGVGLLAAFPALAETRTVQVDTTSWRVVAIVFNEVTTPAPQGRTFVVLTDDAIKVEGGWIYDPVAKTFAAPPAQ